MLHYKGLHLRVSTLLLTNTSAVQMIWHARVLAEVLLSGIATRHVEDPLSGRPAWSAAASVYQQSGFDHTA